MRAIRTTRATSVTAGKTTLVRVLTTLLVPDAGRARVAGYDVVADSASLRSVIGLAGQYAAVDELLTGRENLELVGLWYHLEKPEYRRRAQEVLERFSLTDAGDKLVKGYSGGMRPLFPPFPRMSDIRYREAPRLTRPYGVEGAGRRRRRGRGIRRPQRRWFLVRANPSKDGTAALGQGERLYSAAMDRLAMPGTTAEERKAAKAGTVAERRAYVAARREAARERDADRYRLAVELAQRTQIEIPAAEGFVVVPPGVVESAGAVVAATNAVIDSIGHEQLTAGKGKKAGSIAMGFLPPEQRELGSPYLRFALSAEVVGPIAAYFGIVPVLLEMDAWCSIHRGDTARSSQLWHMDPTDSTQVKMWLYCSDVGLDSGPLTVLPAAASDLLAERIGYAMDERYRVPDDVVESLKTDKTVPLVGRTGSVSFVDTSCCFHFGSRVEAGGVPRRLVWFQYVTPYSFQLSNELTEAPFRELAISETTEIDRRVLGAA